MDLLSKRYQKHFGGEGSLELIYYLKALNVAHARHTQYENITESTKAILFFGTPHGGSDLAKWATLLGKVSSSLGFVGPSKATKDLQTWSPELKDLAIDFIDKAADLQITTFFETESLKGVLVRNISPGLVSRVLSITNL